LSTTNILGDVSLADTLISIFLRANRSPSYRPHHLLGLFTKLDAFELMCVHKLRLKSVSHFGSGLLGGFPWFGRLPVDKFKLNV